LGIDDKLLYNALAVIAKTRDRARRKPRVVMVNQGKLGLTIALYLHDKRLAEVVAYDIGGVAPLAVIDGRVFFIGRLRGGELLSFASCISEAMSTAVVNDKLRDNIVIVTEEHCIWCTPFIHGACKLSYRDGYIVSVVDFNYHPEIWYDKLGVDEVPALVYRGKLVSTGSPENPEQAYEYIKKVIGK